MAKTWNASTALCGRCKRWLPHDAFYRRSDPRYRRPVRSHCRECEIRISGARYHAQRTKVDARHVVYLALKRGELVKEPCEECGNPKVQAHHESYTRPLEVRWLCSKHHSEVHTKERA